MRPYYEQDGIVIYHGDCRELLPDVGRGNWLALVTDPPYGTGWVRGGGAVGEFVAKHERPDWDVWSTDWLRLTSHLVRRFAVFCPISRLADLRSAAGADHGVAYWRKTNPRPNGPDREAIVIWPDNLPETGVEFAAYNGDAPLHPCQKPLDLMKWVLGFIPPHLHVVDPFAGAGSTLLAAKEVGRVAVGIERDEKYCEAAARRLSQGILDFGAA